ncbi:MAG: PAS domain S-box protein [Thermodesulfobacteriota bacterium]
MDAESSDQTRSDGKGGLREGARSGRQKPGIHDALRRLFETQTEGLVLFDVSGTFVQFNRALVEILGHTEEGLRDPTWLQAVVPLGGNGHPPSEEPPRTAPVERYTFRNREIEFTNGQGKRKVVSVNGGLLQERSSGNHLLFASFRDITASKETEEQLRLMVQRLAAYSTDLEKDLRVRNRQLEASRKDLEHQSHRTEKIRDRVQFLLSSIHDQKTDLERRLASNFSLTIRPILEQLKNLSISGPERVLLDVLEFNIINIASYFGLSINQQPGRLTPREMQICQMLRAGQDSRQIAGVLGVSRQTVVVHRKNIRRKFGLKGSKCRLVNYLNQAM